MPLLGVSCQRLQEWSNRLLGYLCSETIQSQPRTCCPTASLRRRNKPDRLPTGQECCGESRSPRLALRFPALSAHAHKARGTPNYVNDCWHTTCGCCPVESQAHARRLLRRSS